MLVSIITPTLNNAYYLTENIRSILDQTYDKVEHIVIDGGSKDDTIQILKSHPTITWKSESDSGMYAAINKGIRMSSGEIIAYLNADDRYFPETLEIVTKEFSINPDVNFVYGYCSYITQSEDIICNFRALPFLRLLNSGVRINFAQPACFWRANVHARLGYFNDQLKICADADFFLRFRQNGLNGRLIREPLSKFMVRDDCLSKTLRRRKKTEFADLRELYNLNFWSWPYLFSEILYYSLNIDSYFKYFQYKRHSLGSLSSG